MLNFKNNLLFIWLFLYQLKFYLKKNIFLSEYSLFLLINKYNINFIYFYQYKYSSQSVQLIKKIQFDKTFWNQMNSFRTKLHINECYIFI